MATLALGVAGAVVGSFFGPLGTSIGWGIGAALGGALFAKGQQGPRLTDLRAQNSAYGQPIPIGYGTIRIAGNVIWADDLVEHKTKSGGKGGPKVTTYSYTQSFAIGLLETSFIDGNGDLVNNPIIGILRIWADGRLLYGEGSEGTTLPITVYLGTEDQEADPTIEAVEGAGDVPAHRGMAYVVFTDLELGGFGNRIPNLTFEVIASGEIQLSYRYRWWVDWDYPIDGTSYASESQLNGVESTPNGIVLHRYRSGDDYGPSQSTPADNTIYYDRRVYSVDGSSYTADAQVTTVLNTAHAHVLGSTNSDIAYAFFNNGTHQEFVWLKAGVVTFAPQNVTSDRELAIDGLPVYWNGWVYAAGRAGTGEDMILRRWDAPGGAVYQEDATLIGFNADAVRTGYPVSDCLADPGVISIGDDGFIWWTVGYAIGSDDGVRLFKLDADLNLIDTWWSDAGAVLPTPVHATVIYRGHHISWKAAGVLDITNPHFVMYRLNSDGTTDFVAECLAGSTSPVYYIGGGLAAVRDGILQLGSNGVPWGDIVSNVSEHVGFDVATEIDVSELTDIVRGYAITTRMSGRAAIEAGMPAYQHGAVESNLQVKFPKWGGNIVATVTADDLGARDDSTDPVDPIEITHAQEKDLPQRIEVVFLNLDMDYQEGTQYATRTASYSDLNAAVSLPLVLTDAEAKAMADVLLFNAWIERDRFKFSLPRKWAHLEPTDVIDCDGHAIRITNKDEQGYTHIQFDGVATHTGVFVTAPVPSPPIGFVPQVPPSLNRTDLILLNAPMTTDSDPQIMFKYATAGRLAGPWPGMSLFKSIDGGVNYDSIASTVEPDTFGVATTVLGNFLGGNIFDELHSVTVRLTPGSGELASSNELGVLNGANMALLGSEVIQFKTATLVAEFTYTLTGLLRGRRGTEWAMGTHSLDDDFVILPCHNQETEFSELEQDRLYKGVTSGGLLSSATAQTFANEGVSLKPYAPVLLGGGRDASGNLTLNWVRRTRVGGGWMNNTEVPLSEPTEAYQVTIYDDSTYTTAVVLISATTETAPYSAADQTTDFGSPQATVYWDVKQLGSAGYGYAQRGST